MDSRITKILALALAGYVALPGVLPESRAQSIENTTGWNGARVYFPPQQRGTANSVDIDGEVGHQLTVWGPQAHCTVPGGWTGTTTIVSGTLPPGLVKDDKDYISGVPTERGHWIVVIRLDPMYCGGASFYGFEQKLMFHIGGSGKVIQ